MWISMFPEEISMYGRSDRARQSVHPRTLPKTPLHLFPQAFLSHYWLNQLF
jgi:hypothetical protein